MTPRGGVGSLGTSLSNYSISYAKGTLTVSARPLTITANDQSRTYGDAKDLGTSLFTTGVGQLVNSDTIASVTLSSAGAAVTAAKGSYDITPSAAVASLGTSLSNYSISYAKGTLTVNARPLTITAKDQSKTYGDVFIFAVTEFSTGLGQLVNSDTIASVTLSSVGAAATAGKGSYDITPSAAGASPGTSLTHSPIHSPNSPPTRHPTP